MTSNSSGKPRRGKRGPTSETVPIVRKKTKTASRSKEGSETPGTSANSFTVERIRKEQPALVTDSRKKPPVTNLLVPTRQENSSTDTRAHSNASTLTFVTTEPQATYAEQLEKSGATLSKTSHIALLRETVRSTLFHKMKFITDDSVLDYGGKVEQTVMANLKLERDDEATKQQYWHTFRGHVNKALNDKRGNVNNEMKKAFMSTYLVIGIVRANTTSLDSPLSPIFP